MAGAYQDVKKGKVILSRPMDGMAQIDQLYTEYTQLAQEVNECHNRIQRFTVSIPNGVTTGTIALPAPTHTTSYFVGAMPPYNAGAIWVTSKTVANFVINFVTLSGTNQTWQFLVLE